MLKKPNRFQAVYYFTRAFFQNYAIPAWREKMNVVQGSCIRLRQNVQSYFKWAAKIPDGNATSAHVLEKKPVGMSEAEAALPLGSGK
jgi:hypothetical protein